jgi:hypothetical protein
MASHILARHSWTEATVFLNIIPGWLLSVGYSSYRHISQLRYSYALPSGLIKTSSPRISTAQNLQLDASVNIPKIRVLPIRHIAESRRIQIPISVSLQSLPLFVLPRKHNAEDHNEHDLDQVAANHAPDAERVLRCLVGLVEEGASDVARAVSQEEDGCRR